MDQRRERKDSLVNNKRKDSSIKILDKTCRQKENTYLKTVSEKLFRKQQEERYVESFFGRQQMGKILLLKIL